MVFSDYLGPTFAVTLFFGRNCLVALHFPANLLRLLFCVFCANRLSRAACLSYFEIIFPPKDDNLGELMSTVCGVHVRGWAGVGACSAER